MKITRVQYTVRAEFAEKNQENIRAVMDELRATGNENVKYAAYRLSDNKTFMHLVHHRSDDAKHLLSSLESFKRFQSDLKPNLEVPPKVEEFSVVGSSFDIF